MIPSAVTRYIPARIARSVQPTALVPEQDDRREEGEEGEDDGGDVRVALESAHARRSYAADPTQFLRLLPRSTPRILSSTHKKLPLDEPWRALPPRIGELIRPHVPALSDEVIEAIRERVPAYRRPLRGRFGAGIRSGVEEALAQFADLVADPELDRSAQPTRVYRASAAASTASAARSTRCSRPTGSAPGSRGGGSRRSRSRRASTGAPWRCSPRRCSPTSTSSRRSRPRATRRSSRRPRASASACAGGWRALLLEPEPTGADRDRGRRRGRLEAPGAGSRRSPGATAAGGCSLAAAGRRRWSPSRATTEGGRRAARRPRRARPRSAALERAAARTHGGARADGRAAVGAARSAERAQRGPAADRAPASSTRPGSRLPTTTSPPWSRTATSARSPSSPRGGWRRSTARRRRRARGSPPPCASWLDHQGEVARVAAELHVHPQTVRYRLARLRELFGDQLDDPEARFELALALRSPVSASSERETLESNPS